MNRSIKSRVTRLEGIRLLGRPDSRDKAERDAMVARSEVDLLALRQAGGDTDEHVRAIVEDADISPGTIGERRFAAVRAWAGVVLTRCAAG